MSNSNDILKRFEFGARVNKAWVNKETGKHYVSAIASDTGVDYHHERFSEKALKGMVQCIQKEHPAAVLFLPTHWDTFEIGKAVEAKVIDSPEKEELKALEVQIELDMDYPQSKKLYKEVESGRCKKQLSVGGYLNPESDKPYFWEEKEYETDDGNKFYDYILVLDDLILDHIAATREKGAANDRTGFSEAIAKSLDIKRPEERTDQLVGAKAEKQAQTLIEHISKGIKEFFKADGEDHVKTQAALTSIDEVKASIESLKAIESDQVKEALKGIAGLFAEVEKSIDPEVTEVEPEVTEVPEEENTSIDEDALKSNIINEVSKSLEDSQQETFKEIAKSLGEVISETIKSQLTPLQEKIYELEKAAGKSKSLTGQEDNTVVVEKSEENDQEDNMWSGFIKGAIPKHLLQERKLENEDKREDN